MLRIYAYFFTKSQARFLLISVMRIYNEKHVCSKVRYYCRLGKWGCVFLVHNLKMISLLLCSSKFICHCDTVLKLFEVVMRCVGLISYGFLNPKFVDSFESVAE